jgi:hypothetical protein
VKNFKWLIIKGIMAVVLCVPVLVDSERSAFVIVPEKIFAVI